MLKSLRLKNFTVFPSAELKFGRYLNVIVGENGLGKTHLLKAAYCALAVSARGARESGSNEPAESHLQTAIANKLRNVFKPDELGRLARRQAGKDRTEVECRLEGATTTPVISPRGTMRRFDLAFSFDAASKSEVTIDRLPADWISEVAVYMPTRELITIASGFVSLYETTHLQFEETWRDTAILLGAPLARGAREAKIRPMLGPLEEALGGAVESDDQGRFYLKTKTARFEMHLVAEGLRKLAMIARLIATGSLLGKGYLFWDEPEANLNPKLVKLVARTILDLGRNGIQVFIATHSLFLMRELHILQQTQYPHHDTRCFGLHPAGEDTVAIQEGETMDDIGNISALDEQLAQSKRYTETENELTTA
jgi:ABC-type lipoprotein export system ATPase subunit